MLQILQISLSTAAQKLDLIGQMFAAKKEKKFKNMYFQKWQRETELD